MRKKLKKIFENAVWWSGVVMVGLILGVSLQVVRAWTEPTQTPPGGNVGAPINTSNITQNKSGILGVLGLLTSYLNVPGSVPNPGDVLTAQNAVGQVVWAAGGGGCYTQYVMTLYINNNCGGNVNKCACLTGFTNKGSIGNWGACGSGDVFHGDRPAIPGPVDRTNWECDLDPWHYGKAYVCCQ